LLVSCAGLVYIDILITQHIGVRGNAVQLSRPPKEFSCKLLEIWLFSCQQNPFRSSDQGGWTHDKQQLALLTA
jgi:hypothetical protein